MLFFFFSNFTGLTKSENMTASFHPSDVPNIEAFKSFGVETFTENVPVVKRSEVIFVSVKPSVVPTVLENVRPVSDEKLFLSIAMGVKLADLEKVI